MRVLDLIDPKVARISFNDTVTKAAKLFSVYNYEMLPVVDESGIYNGMVEKEQVVYTAGHATPGETVAGLIQKIPALNAFSPLDAVLADFSVLPVTDNIGRLLGVISKHSVLSQLVSSNSLVRDELNAILNAAHNAILAVDKNGHITIFNPAAERIVGVSYTDAIGKPIWQIIPQTEMLEILKTGESRSGQKLHINDRTVVTNRTPVFKDGEIVGAVAVFQDISELENITVELQSFKRLNKELEALIDSSYDGIYVTDGRGYTIRVNSAYERITGVHRNEVLGKHMGELEKLA